MALQPLAAGWWAVARSVDSAERGRRYRMEVRGRPWARGSRGALVPGWRAGRALRSERRAAPRLALPFRVRRGRADSSRPVTVVGSSPGAATARGPRGQVGAVWRTSPGGRVDFAHSPYTTLPVPLARPSVGSALHPQDGVWRPSRGADPEAGDSGERCRGAAPARSGALGIGKRGAHSEESSARAFPAVSRASALQAGESGWKE